MNSGVPEVVPVLRPHSWLLTFDHLPLEDRPIWTFAGDDFISALYRPAAQHFVTAGDIAKQGISLIDAIDTAANNFIAANSSASGLNIQIRPAQAIIDLVSPQGDHAPGIQIRADNGYASSWLTHRETLRAVVDTLGRYFNDVPLFFPITTDLLIAAPTGADGLELLYQFAMDTYRAAGTDAISALAHTCDDVALQLWTPQVARPERRAHLYALQQTTLAPHGHPMPNYSGQGAHILA
ncbi:hypothetical protein [Corynebacterium ulceribovis]|uniref:hypothetical protein n=1 Tax=Corynebacterium ulceribovis TaxID=487732 RepID=UPI00035EFB59|nr:hypothetical protein [Corynebacterium ulceribovis]